MSNIKNLSFLFENSDPFVNYSREREEEALARETFYVLEEMLNDKSFVIQEGVLGDVWAGVKDAGKKIAAAGKGAIEGAKQGWKGYASEKTKKIIEDLGHQFLKRQENKKGTVTFIRNGEGKIEWLQDREDAAGFIKAARQMLPKDDQNGLKEIAKWLVNNAADVDPKEVFGTEDSSDTSNNSSGSGSGGSGDSASSTSSKEEKKDEVVDTSVDGQKQSLQQNLKEMRKINVNDFISAFKEAKNDPSITTVIGDQSFSTGIQNSLVKYLDLKIASEQDGTKKQTYEKLKELFKSNGKLARPIGYAAATMMNHMVGELIGKEGAVDKMKATQDRLERTEGHRAARKINKAIEPKYPKP